MFLIQLSRSFFSAFSDRTNYESLDALLDLDLPQEVYRAYNLFGILMLISYSVICGILLGNLLIAIITNRYK